MPQIKKECVPFVAAIHQVTYSNESGTKGTWGPQSGSFTRGHSQGWGGRGGQGNHLYPDLQSLQDDLQKAPNNENKEERKIHNIDWRVLMQHGKDPPVMHVAAGSQPS